MFCILIVSRCQYPGRDIYYHSFVRCYYWGKVVKGYMWSLCIIPSFFPPHPLYVEVPRPGIAYELEFRSTPQLQQHQILNALSHEGTPFSFLLLPQALAKISCPRNCPYKMEKKKWPHVLSTIVDDSDGGSVRKYLLSGNVSSSSTSFLSFPQAEPLSHCSPKKFCPCYQSFSFSCMVLACPAHCLENSLIRRKVF